MSEIAWPSIRARYPAASKSVYLNAGSRGLISLKAFRAGVASLERDLSMETPGLSSAEELSVARALFARIIGAHSDEIAITKNVSEGLNAVATAIDWRPGDNVVLCPDLEHSNNIYLWHALKRRGVEVRSVSHRRGAIDPAAFASAIDERTRLVTVSAVTFIPGFRTDLRMLSATARSVGALFLVDGVQACGVLKIDVEADGVDALATSTSKGLLGVRGLGFLYVRRDWCEQLTPAYVARNSFDAGDRHYSEFECADASLKATAQRFECGNYNFAGAAVASAAMSEILDIGVETIEARATTLAQMLARGLLADGWPVNQPPPGVKPSHLVTLGGPVSDAGAALDSRLSGLAQKLSACGIRFAVRRGLLRFGFHLYNDENDIAAVLEASRDAASAAA